MSDLRSAESGNGLAVLLSWLQPGASAAAAEPANEPAPARDFEAEILAARAEGYADGEAAGRVDAEAALAPMAAALEGAEAALKAACVIDAAAVQPALAALVRQLCESVLMAELGADSGAALAPLVVAALAEVKPGEAAVLRAHPDTLALLEGQFEAVMGQGDAGMARDAFAVEGPDFVIETGLMARLEAMLADLAMEGGA
jgi:flagellar biosynthesis/type III secretory pathway protein FliH